MSLKWAFTKNERGARLNSNQIRIEKRNKYVEPFILNNNDNYNKDCYMFTSICWLNFKQGFWPDKIK